MSSILVTGGAGFIGSHACKEIAAAGFLPVTIDNLSTGHRDAVRWGPFYEADLRNCDAVLEVLNAHEISTVMHFAASAYVGESMQDPSLYYDNNVGGMISLLKACRQADVDRFIFSSSCATYGLPETLPIHEELPQFPINPYGRTKLIGEQMLMDHAQAYGLRYVILRYFNACGADPEGELTERHNPETHLIPLALQAAAGKRGALDIFGDDYDTPDGTCIRDYIHVSDLAIGHVAAVEHLRDGGENTAVNLGCGQGHSILQIARIIETVTGCAVPTRMAPRRAGDPPILYADCAKAERILGFKARNSDIKKIIRDAAPGFGLTVLHD